MTRLFSIGVIFFFVQQSRQAEGNKPAEVGKLGVRNHMVKPPDTVAFETIESDKKTLT